MDMGETGFYIVFNLRTCQGYESFGKFFVANNPESAKTIFSKLRGQENINEKNALQLDLMESRNGLPLNVQMITCSLEELAENCKLITKEIFRLKNLEDF